MTGSDTIKAAATRAAIAQDCAAHRPVAHDGRGRPIEHWLRRSLADTYDRVLTEDLPQAWLSLIDGKRPGGGGA